MSLSKLDRKYIESKPNILWSLIKKYPNKDWNWYWISRNPNILLDIIEKYSDKPWDWGWISCNPNLTMEFIEKYPDKPWHWGWISDNKFLYNEIVYQKKLKKDIKHRKNEIKFILSKYINKDMVNTINKFIYYN